MGRLCGENSNERVMEGLKECCKYSEVKLPYYLLKTEGCDGCVKDDGLINKCGGEVVEGVNLCEKCQKKCKEVEGIPLPYGLFSYSVLSDEELEGMSNSTITQCHEVRKKRKSWGKYLKDKFSFGKEDGLRILIMHGIDADKVPMKEWTTRVVSSTTVRLLPIKGKRKSPGRGDPHHQHKDGETGCVVHFVKKTGIIIPIKWEEWSQEGKDKFVEMYGKPDEKGYGRDKPKKEKKRKKKEETPEWMKKVLADRDRMAEELEMFKKELRDRNQKILEEKTEKVVKKIKKTKKIKKSSDSAKKLAEKLEEEKKLAEKLEEEKKLAEKLEEEKKIAEKSDEVLEVDPDFEDSEDDSEDESDDDAFVFNPFQYNGIKYHLDDGEIYHFPPQDDQLLQFGILNEDGTVEIL